MKDENGVFPPKIAGAGGLFGSADAAGGGGCGGRNTNVLKAVELMLKSKKILEQRTGAAPESFHLNKIYFKSSTNSSCAGPSAKGLYTRTTFPSEFMYRHVWAWFVMSTYTAKPT